VVSGSAHGPVIFCDGYREKRVAGEVLACPKHVQGRRHPEETPEQYDSRIEESSRSSEKLQLDKATGRRATVALIISILALLATAVNALVNYLRFHNGH
jgi:hypothetical protein